MAEKKNSRKIALLSDIHGNLPALEAVLEDAARRRAVQCWNLGDFLGYAPFPNEVVKQLRDVCAVSLIGNYDLKVLSFKKNRAKWRQMKSPEKYAAFEWNDAHLSGSTRTYLQSLPQQRRLEIEGCTALLVHGSPAAIDECLRARTPDRRLAELASAANTDLIVCGHSHEAFVRQVGETCFVNPGSVGRPEGEDRRASYALLEWTSGNLNVRHRRIEYDLDRVTRSVRAAGLPESFADVFRTAESLDQIRQEVPCDSHEALDAVLSLARSCDYEREHTHQVTRLALILFTELKELHRLGPRDEFRLQCGALLHDIGWVHGRQRHHKTALQQIIADPKLPFDDRERRIVGLIARYHRRALPSDGHEYFGRLSEEDRRRVCVLGGILRVADGLDRSHRSVIRTVRCRVLRDEIVIACQADGPGDAEVAAAQKKSDLLETVFHRPCCVTVAWEGGSR